MLTKLYNSIVYVIFQFNTRDTFGFALKSTYAIKENKEIFLFKDPITDDGTKKSQKGMVAVIENESGELELVDQLYQSGKDKLKGKDLLKPLFENGKLLRETSFREIRERLNK